MRLPRTCGGEQQKEGGREGGSPSRDTRHTAVDDAFVCLPHVVIVSAVAIPLSPFFSHPLAPLHPLWLATTEVMFSLLDAAAKVACIEADAL